MSFHDLERTILHRDLCASCGVCAPACPRNLIRFDDLHPVLVAGASATDCADCQDCVNACPGEDPDTAGSERWLFGRVRTWEERWLGVHQEVYGAAATAPVVFDNSASGGAATALLRAAAESMGLDAVLVMGRDPGRPWRAAPVLCDDLDRLHEYAQSTYQLTPFLEPLSDLFREHPSRRIAMSATACHVQALRKLQRSGTALGELARRNVAFVLEIACSSSTKPAGTESMITELLDAPLENVASLRYRQGEYPGEIGVKTKDGKVHTVPFWKAVRHFSDNKTHRCLSCGDWLSGLADVSVSDGDPNIFKASLGANDISKHGRVFVRTNRGQEVLAHAQRTGSLHAWSIELLGQNLGLERKRNRRAAYELSGKAIPRGPVEGFLENVVVVDDSQFLMVPREDEAGSSSTRSRTTPPLSTIEISAGPSMTAKPPIFASSRRIPPGSPMPRLPSDKSISQRALLFAAASSGTTILRRLNFGGAITPLIDALRLLGVPIALQPDGSLHVGELPAAAPGREEPYLNLGRSSAAARMLLGLLVGRGVGAVIDGDATLRQRPMTWAVDPLRELGAQIDYLSQNQLPIRLRPATLRAGSVVLQVGSAQAQSAVLFAAFGAGVPVQIEQQVNSRDHTVRMLRALGAELSEDGPSLSFRPASYRRFDELEIPVDPSAAAYPVAAHLLTRAPSILRIDDVCLNPTRTGFFELLRQGGAEISYENIVDRFGEPVGTVCVAPSLLSRPLRMDDTFLFHAMIDEVPLAAAVATQLPGTSEFLGAGELTFKETNRLITTRDMLRGFGASVECEGDALRVHGGAPLRPGIVQSFDDHRIAMSAAVLGCLFSDPTTVLEGSCCETSFPHFPDVLTAYGFDVRESRVERDAETVPARITMRKVLKTRGGGQVECVEEAIPEVAAQQVRIRCAVSLVSPGTERHYVESWTRPDEPLALGYCVAGTVEETAPEVKTVAVGDRVIAMGWQYAVHATHVVVPQRLCVRVPAGLPLEQAVFANIAATALHAIHRASLVSQDVVLVVGAGLVGQLVAQCARSQARRVIVADRIAGRLAGPRSLGFDTLVTRHSGSEWGLDGDLPEQVTKIFLCISGDSSLALRECIRILQPRTPSKVQPALIGVGRFEALVDFSVDMGNVDIRYSARCGSGYRDDDYVHGRSDYAPPPGQGRVEDNLAECLQLIHQGVLDVGAIPVQRCELEEAIAAHGTFDRDTDGSGAAPVALLIRYPGPQSAKAAGLQGVAPGLGFELFEYDPGQTLHARFEAIVARYPNRMAVRTPEQSWTYAELNEHSNRVARLLRRRLGDSIGRVALLFEHSAPMVSGILGVLKAGGTYVPLDAAYPEDRLRYMRQDSGSEAVLTTSRYLTLAEFVAGGEVPCIDAASASEEADGNLLLEVDAGAPAYILYTSGSTGLPKGVVQLHRNVAHHMRVWTNRLGISANDRLSLQSAYSWDSAVQDTFGALLVGAALYPVNVKALGFAGLVEWFIQEGITIYHSTLPIFRSVTRILEARRARLSSVRALVLGGDLIYGTDVELFRRYFSPAGFLINAYGATESTTALLNVVRADSEQAFSVFPLGFPVEETDVYLVDDHGQRVEVGEGEVRIRSAYLAARYWGEVDQGRFEDDPDGGARRIYRTGDIARYLPEGGLAYVGRRDFQVKIRGMRVELGEVEAALKELPDVQDAVVMAPELTPGERELVAYVVAGEQAAFLADAARSALARRLPDHSLPSRFVVLSRLPLTPNGKIDRAALPKPDATRPTLSTAFVSPRSSHERAVTTIWSDVLKIADIGINDNFFDLGGTSLKLAEVNGLLRERMGRTITMVDLYRAPTVAAIAQLLAADARPAARPTDAGQARGALRAQLRRPRGVA